MGSVMRARDRLSGTKIALKILKPDLRDMAPAFINEYTVQRRLRHPAIPRVYDFGFAAWDGVEVPYYTMEEIHGVSAATFRDMLPPLDQTWIWVIEVLQALGRIHRAGYVHRDVKPDNIMVDPNAHQGGVRLIDFGIAVEQGATPEPYFVGTPDYAAPEVMETFCATPSSDLYAVGIVLYELIEGRAPWDAEGMDALHAARVNTPPTPILEPQCPQAVRDLIGALLAPDPADRPATADEVIIQLAEAADLPAIFETTESIECALAASLPTGSLTSAICDSGRSIVAVEGCDTAAASLVMREAADREAVLGRRVLKVTLAAGDASPLGGVDAAVDVLAAVRGISGEASLGILPDLASAAVLMTQVKEPTLLVIEELQRASLALLGLIRNVFTGAAIRNLRVITSIDSSEPAAAPRALERLLNEPFTLRMATPAVNLRDARTWLHRSLGAEVLPPDVLERWVHSSSGTALRIMRRVVNGFRHGVIERDADGFLFHAERETDVPVTIQASRAPTELPDEPPLNDAYDRLAALRVPLPRGVVVRFFSDAELSEWLRRGVLVETGAGWVLRTQREPYVTHFDNLGAGRRAQLNRALYNAVEAHPVFDGRIRLLALLGSETARPGLAVPWLVALADRAIAEAVTDEALALLARAAKLLQGEADDEQGWDWRVMLAHCELRYARRFDDLARLASAGHKLIALAGSASDVPTLRAGVEARLDHAHRTADWERLERLGRAALRIDPSGPSAQDQALCDWASAWTAWADGDVGPALAAARRGAELVDFEANVPLSAALRLYDLLVDLSTSARRHDIAKAAVRRFVALASRAEDVRWRVYAVSYQARYLRQIGRPHRALVALDDAAPFYDGLRDARALSIVALERSRCHLAFGDWPQAAQDAHQAALDAARGHYTRLEFLANTCWARAQAGNGDTDECRRVTEGALSNPPAGVMPPDIHEVHCLSAKLDLDEGHAPADVIARALEVAEAAQASGDATWAVRAATVAVQASLVGDNPLRAVRLSDLLSRVTSRLIVLPVPLHLIRALRARAHFRMKWFGSAAILSQSAMEALRSAALRIEDAAYRQAWLTAPDNAIVGLVADLTEDVAPTALPGGAPDSTSQRKTLTLRRPTRSGERTIAIAS